jgi:hypothetical protein
VRVSLWVLPSTLIVSAARRIASAGEEESESDDTRPAVRDSHGSRGITVGSIVWAIEVAAKRIPQATCLTQALAAQLLLRRYGFRARLALGVRAGTTRDFTAHAWLETREGEGGRTIIGGPVGASFTRLPDITNVRARRRPARRT